ncbi:Hint domain-containing protein [Fusibacter ferrireducens]|uniref:Hint domain-containing protein n=1 Tax=Fusibacter ferrireducens TaxID=2785058 RepID=A0ABR9ZRM0_9FIRM|nr:Hint domain-containing protein [Fusibacter ferrireducens]MBF4693101.1 hypothetical protein [Fusibacter ferrireducens]
MLTCISQVQNKLVNEIDKSSGVLQHDYSNPLHYDYILESFGGEKHLSEKYPAFLKMLRASKQEHTLMRQGGNQAVAVLSEKDGFRDNVCVDCVNFDPVDVMSIAKADFIEDKPIIAISAQLIDKSNDRLEDVINVYGEDEISRFEGIMKKLTSELIRSEDREFKVVADFHWMNENENGAPTMASATAMYDDLKVYGTNTIVSNFVVNDPMPKHKPTRDHVVVVYNRQAQVGDDYDYAFNNNKEGDFVKVFLPTSGTVTVSSEFEVLSLNKDYGYRLEIQDLNKGVVFYYAGVDTVTSSVSTDKKSITWRFLDNWNNKLNVSNFGAKTTVNIYNRMGIDVKHKSGMIMTVPVVFQSNGSKSQDKSSILSKPIMIQWGCLSKATQVLMSDQTYKIVSDIQVGDLVLNEKMEIVQVKDIYTGHEEMMVFVESMKGKKIRVTAGHPVCTARGFVAAAQLTAGDKLVTVDGEEDIVNLRVEPYNDKVYSLAFENESTIICEGIHVGDFSHQQNLKEEEMPKKVVKRSEACNLARKEFKMVFDELAQKNKK